MNLKSTAKFIQDCRKEKKLTQVQLAIKLGVSEKTVSKWETGRGFPDTSLILPLCKELGITANELLSSKKIISEVEYKESAEENLVILKGWQERTSKRFLALEYLLIWLGMALLLGCVLVASYVELQTVYRILLIAFGFINVLAVCIVSIIIETKVGFYECQHCGHKYVPSYSQVLWAMHMGRTRYMECPNCHKKSWQKKRTSLDK